MKETEQALEDFHLALDKMSYKVPAGKIRGSLSLVKECIKQYFKGNSSKKNQTNIEGFYDKARCLIHLIHVYHSLNRRMRSLVPAFKLLELAENATCSNSHEVSLPCRTRLS